MTTPSREKGIPDNLIRVVRERLCAGQRVRRTLPRRGRIHVDRPLPFVCLYRRPLRDDPGTERIVTSEASYVICSADRSLRAGLAALVESVAEVLVDQFGACLLLELWAARPQETGAPVTIRDLVPEFRIIDANSGGDVAMTDELEQALSRVRLASNRARVSTSRAKSWHPPGLPPILDARTAQRIGCHIFGLEMDPVYRDANGGDVFPRVLRQLRRVVSVSLRRAFFEYSRKRTTLRPPHFHTLGRRAVVKAVWQVDRMLAESSDQFDFLLQVTPVNGDEAWNEFRRSRFQVAPPFDYRPLPAEPAVLKRQLFRAPVERIEDPALAQLFRQKLFELDRQITMLQDRNTARFLHGSVQLYGRIEPELRNMATAILDQVAPRTRDEPWKNQVGAEAFARRAAEEIAFLKEQDPSMPARVEVRPDISGLMVSRGNLLVGTSLRIARSRVEALIQHEVGTHIVTFHNGQAQPLRQLSRGLAGYDALQEGLAVLAEYLAGGLSRPRLRMLAARVLAAQMLMDGASFVDTFRTLDVQHDFRHRTAYNITMRTYRGGGFTKDIVYLRGLMEILDYLGDGGSIDPLLIGKLAVEHIPIIKELTWRGVLGGPPLTPRYLAATDAPARLERLRSGLSVLDLVKRRSS